MRELTSVFDQKILNNKEERLKYITHLLKKLKSN